MLNPNCELSSGLSHSGTWRQVTEVSAPGKSNPTQAAGEKKPANQGFGKKAVPMEGQPCRGWS